MKNQAVLLIAFVALAFATACTSGGEKTKATDAKEVKTGSFDQAYLADTKTSTIRWEGYKPTGTHDGTIQINNGKLETRDGQLIGGSFNIDMKTIVVTDIEDADQNGKLTGHLNSADFFDVATFPKAKFVITDVQAVDASAIDKTKEKGDIIPTHTITGNLTMKDITKSISFNAKVAVMDDWIKANTNQFFIDRAQWNIQYGSRSFFDDLKDKFINDEIGLTIQLAAKLN